MDFTDFSNLWANAFMGGYKALIPETSVSQPTQHTLLLVQFLSGRMLAIVVYCGFTPML